MPDQVLQILRRVSEIIAENEQIDTAMTKIVALLAQSLQATCCSIYTWDEEAGNLVLRTTHGLNPAYLGRLRPKPGEGLTGMSFQEGEIINIDDATEHPRFKHQPELGEEAFRAFMAVPLVGGGCCAGILTLQDARPRRFKPAVVNLVKALSSQLANLIFNAKLLAELAKIEEPEPEPNLAGQVMLRGVAANPGLGLGQVTIFERFDHFAEIHPAYHANADQELLLFEYALRQARRDTIELEKRATELISEADSSIFTVHLLFLEDRTIIDAIRDRIVGDRCSIEYAIKLVNDEFQARFARLNSAIFRDKAMDFKDVMLRLLTITIQTRHHGDADRLVDAPPLAVHNQILFSRELLPSDLIRLPLDRIVGIVCEKGGATAHTAVLAKALNIPALMGVSRVMQEIREGDQAVLDGAAEVVYLRPSPEVWRQFQELQQVRQQLTAQPDPAPTTLNDGAEIILRANLSLIGETALLATYGARGIGLYRSEFLFMIRDHLPDEDTQFQVFRKIVQGAQGEKVSIRVLDVGADKPLPYLKHPHEDNPALGWRGIRMLLDRPDILMTQLKAILRAATAGPVRILFPMVTSREEVVRLRQALTEAEAELHAQAVEHAAHYQVGIMVEVPAAVFGLSTLLKYVDYVSIGSNDLFQYTFAVDRGNDKVAAAFQYFHPVFLAIIAQIAQTVYQVPGKELALCGEMAGNPMAVPLLIGAGIDDLSMSPSQIPPVKQVIRAFSRNECQELLSTALQLETPEAVAIMIRRAFLGKGLQG